MTGRCGRCRRRMERDGRRGGKCRAASVEMTVLGAERRGKSGSLVLAPLAFARGKQDDSVAGGGHSSVVFGGERRVEFLKGNAKGKADPSRLGTTKRRKARRKEPV